jgi:flagellar biosynthesis protein
MATRRARAAALEFAPSRQTAPRLVAKGDGLIAERILAIAREHGIPIREDRALVDLLARLDLNDQIPPELYGLVAEVIAWVYRMQARAATSPDRRGRSSGVR